MSFEKVRQLQRLMGKSMRYLKANGVTAFIKRVKYEFMVKNIAPFCWKRALSNKPIKINELIYNHFFNSRPLCVYQAPNIKHRLNLVTDSINEGSLFGGVATAMIFSALLAEHWGCGLRVITRTEKPKTRNFKKILESNDIPLTRNVEFNFADIKSEKSLVDVGKDDIFITTSWWTTKSVLQSVDATQIIYLLQEDERMFYPYGDDHLKCSEILRNDRLKYVVNTRLLFDHFASEGFSNIRKNGVWFEPSFNPNSYYLGDSLISKKGKKRFFFYGRPNNQRNLFYLGLEVISKAIGKKIINSNEWDIYFVGINIPLINIGDNFKPIIIPNMTWDEYSAFIRKVDLGLCLMYTPHPSYPPLDLAASGAVVVTNKYGAKSNLDCYSRNIICKDASIEALLDGLMQGISLAENLELKTKNYKENRLLRDWKKSFHNIIQQLSRD